MAVTVAVVGLGRRGRAHLDSWQCLPRVTVVGVADHDHGARDSAEVPTFTDHAALVRGVGAPDVVSIAIAPAGHVAVAADLLAAGVGVVVIEKPVALTTEDTERLAAFPGARTRIAVGFQESWIPDVQTLVGRPWTTLHLRRFGPEPDRAHPGLLLDLGIHSLHLAATLATGPLTVAAAHIDPGIVRTTLTDGNGFTAHISFGWAPTVERTLVVEGSDGRCDIDLAGGPQRGAAAPLARLLADAADARVHGRPPAVGLDAGITAHRLIDSVTAAGSLPHPTYTPAP